MLRKLYSENISEVRNIRSHGEYADGVGKKRLDFQFYWSALLRNKWLIIFFTALMTTMATIYSLMAVPIYAGNATLLLESQKANIISIEDLVSSEQESNDYYGTQYAILRSRALAARVLDHLQRSEDISQPQLAKMLSPASSKAISTLGDGSKDDAMSLADRLDKTDYNNVINRFRESLKITPIVKTKLVKISYDSTDPEFAALAANAVATQYIENAIAQRKLRRGDASKWMDSRVQELKIKLEDSEDALLSFKKVNGLIDLDGDVGRLNDQQLLFTSSELAKAKGEMSNARDLYLKTQNYKITSPKLLETLPYVQNNVTVRSANADLVRGQRNIAELRNRYGAKHPIIVDARSNFASLRSALNDSIERAVAAFENDYQLLQQRVESLEDNVTQSKASVQGIGQKKVSLDALEREAASNRDQYNKMFDRITEIRTTDGLDEANAVVSEAAWVPTNPIRPNKVLIVGFVMLASLLLAAAVSFIKEYLDDTVNKKSDIEKRLRSKLIGVIPLVERESSQRENENPITPSDAVDSSETFLEAVNTCRTALSVRGRKNSKVILVTSSVPNEGKSTIALNLAYSFGQLERTLLIDCDLRRPSIAAVLGMQADDAGLTNLLLNKSIKPGSMQFGVWGSFDCLTSGPVPENPQELLASDKFAKGLRMLRNQYDRIIIDCAPTHAVSDAIVLSQLVDEVLYVVKPHETPIKLVDNGLSRLAEAQATVAGICISQVDIRKSKSYGDMEFHGFGLNYQGYGKYFTPRERYDNAPLAKLAS
ncbi:MAG: polysaccharide biosynthesis tyrosine autokinase [Granulosicoccaceae bacterium]